MSIKSILEIVWGRYGLAGAAVVVVILVALDQLYGYGLAGMITAFLAGGQ